MLTEEWFPFPILGDRKQQTTPGITKGLSWSKIPPQRKAMQVPTVPTKRHHNYTKLPEGKPKKTLSWQKKIPPQRKAMQVPTVPVESSQAQDDQDRKQESKAEKKKKSQCRFKHHNNVWQSTWRKLFQERKVHQKENAVKLTLHV